MIIAGILVVVLFVGLSGGDISELGKNKAVITLLAVLGLVLFLLATGLIGSTRAGGDILGTIVMLVFLGLVVYFIVGKGGS